MKIIEVKTQAELDSALAKVNPEEEVIVITGTDWVRVTGSAHVEARESAHVEARESAHVEARESAHVEARESAHVVARESAHVEARGSAHVVARGSAHVEAWESAHVEAWESAHVEARGSAHVEASKYVAITKQPNHKGKIAGGVLIKIPRLTNPRLYCSYWGLKTEKDTTILFKAVDKDLKSGHKMEYPIGKEVIAPDWDNGVAECGGGLHLSPHPSIAKSFFEQATRFLRCSVKLKDMANHPDGNISKVKVRACKVLYEVDIEGKRL